MSAIERLQRFAVSVHGPHVYINFSGADGGRASALFQIGVDECSEIFVGRLATLPDSMQIEEHISGETKSSPDPVCRGVLLLHLNHPNRAFFIGDDGVEEFGMRNGEEKEGERIVRKAR